MVLLDDPGPPDGASDRGLGIAARGGLDSPARLKHALPDDAEPLWRWSGRAVSSLLDRSEALGVSVDRAGTWRLSLGPDEAREWEASATLLDRWGVDSRTLTADQVAAEGLGQGFDAGLWIGGEGRVDLQALVAALRARIDGRVARRSGPGAVVATLGGVRIDAPDGPLDAEMAVIASGAGAPSAHPWFGPMILPVRLQGLRVPGAQVPGPALVRHRFEAWASDPGGLSFVGCRWAEQPEMEAGVTDDATCSPRVEAKAREFLLRHHPALDLSSAHAWSGVAAWSCDGLPLVGPLPGEPRVMALCGWGGWGLSWIGAAVDDLTAAILGEAGGDRLPHMLRPRRMI